jgi:hypothetical protein
MFENCVLSNWTIREKWLPRRYINFHISILYTYTIGVNALSVKLDICFYYLIDVRSKYSDIFNTFTVESLIIDTSL